MALHRDAQKSCFLETREGCRRKRDSPFYPVRSFSPIKPTCSHLKATLGDKGEMSVIVKEGAHLADFIALDAYYQGRPSE